MCLASMTFTTDGLGHPELLSTTKRRRDTAWHA